MKALLSLGFCVIEFFDDFWSFFEENKGEKCLCKKEERRFYSEWLCETKRVIAVFAAFIQTNGNERGLVFVFPR